MFFYKKVVRYAVDLTWQELIDVRDALIQFRNKLIADDKPTEDFDALIIKICKLF